MKTSSLAITILLAAGTAMTAPREVRSADAGAAIAELARSGDGKTYGRGECWDFAAALLDATGCQWERPFGFGRALDLKKEALQPGDILQFESVKLEWKRENRRGTIHLGFPQHTAIVLSANGSVVEMAHQNYNQVRKVTRLSLDLREITAGKVTAYRPVKNP